MNDVFSNLHRRRPSVFAVKYVGHEAGGQEAGLVEVDDIEYSVVTGTCEDEVCRPKVRVVEFEIFLQGEDRRDKEVRTSAVCIFAL